MTTCTRATRGVTTGSPSRRSPRRHSPNHDHQKLETIERLFWVAETSLRVNCVICVKSQQLLSFAKHVTFTSVTKTTVITICTVSQASAITSVCLWIAMAHLLASKINPMACKGNNPIAVFVVPRPPPPPNSAIFARRTMQTFTVKIVSFIYVLPITVTMTSIARPS